MRHSPILILFLLCRMVLYCQSDTTKSEPYVYFNAFSVILGFGGTESQSHNTDYFKNLAPENAIAQIVPSYAKSINMNGNTGNTMLNLGFNIHLKTKDLRAGSRTFSSEWRVGLNIATLIKEKHIVSNEITQHVDTFYSDHTSMVKYEGNVNEDIYQYTYKSKNAYLDISKTYHINSLKRWSFYTGINVGVGYTFANTLSATFLTDSTNYKRRRYYSLEKREGAVTERTKLGNELYYNATVPVGIILRKVSKKKQTAYPFSCFAEARLGYAFQKNYGSTYNKIPLTAFMIGVKIYFNKQKTVQ